MRASVVTFAPHPMTVLRPELAPRELCTPRRQIELVEEAGADELVLIRFDHAFSQLTPDQFAEGVLAAALRARHVVVGANFRYGHRAAGSPETLAAEGELLGFTVEQVPLLEVAGSPVSSSRIRDLLSAGDVKQAARLLGRPAWVEGEVVHGDGRGRGLGFPTANLRPAHRAAPPGTGIYAGVAHLDGRALPAAVSVGFNPTFSDDRETLRIEAHLLDFDADLYGQRLRIDLTARLRGELKFGSVEELVAQVHRDIDAVRALAVRS